MYITVVTYQEYTDGVGSLPKVGETGSAPSKHTSELSRVVYIVAGCGVICSNLALDW